MTRLVGLRTLRSCAKALAALLISLTCILGSGANADGIQPVLIEPEVGKQYFTRYSFKEEKGKHNTTNYWRGNLVPINSRVKLLSMGRKKMAIELENGSRVTFINVSKYTKRRMIEIASELLSPVQIPLDGLKSSIREGILSGDMRLGMNKEQVIMARGHPPRHKTPSIDNDIWTYWSSKFVKRTVVFDNGVLSEGRGLQ